MLPFYHSAAYYHGHPRYYFGGRRIFWFAIGAATAIWWNRRRDEHGHFCGGYRRQPERLEQGHVDRGNLHDVSPSDIRKTQTLAPQNSKPPSTDEWWDKEKGRLFDVGKQATESVSICFDALITYSGMQLTHFGHFTGF